jgi:peptidase A4-like protein
MSKSVVGLVDFTFDEEAFRKKIPHKLHPTHLKGVYSTPAPPEEFDPNTASRTELIKHGLLWRRPTSRDPPNALAAWDKVFSRKWLAKDRIVPAMHPRPGGKHYRTFRPNKLLGGPLTTNDWAGVVVVPPTGVTSVIGSWMIPSVSKPTQPSGGDGGWQSASWVGIDGIYVSNDILQAGVAQNVDLNGNASYNAWFEWFVSPPNLENPSPLFPPIDGYPLSWLAQCPYILPIDISNTDFPVNPGDWFYCSVQYINGNTAGSIFFANGTTGHNFQLTLAPPPSANFNGTTAEWIMEAPDDGEGNTRYSSSLPRFTPVTFQLANACDAHGRIYNPASITAEIVNITTDGHTTGTYLTAVSIPQPGEVTVEFIG